MSIEEQIEVIIRNNVEAAFYEGYGIEGVSQCAEELKKFIEAEKEKAFLQSRETTIGEHCLETGYKYLTFKDLPQ